MRKVITLTIIGILLLPAVSGAVLEKVVFGPKLGINMAGKRGDLALWSEDPYFELVPPFAFNDEPGSRMTEVWGAYVEYPVTPMFSARLEALYTVKGYKRTGWWLQESPNLSFRLPYEFVYSLAYLEFPLLLRVDIPTGIKIMKPYTLVGPAIAFNMSAEREREYLRIQGFADRVKDYVKNVDYGLVVGGGLEFPIGAVRLSLEGRYEIGLTSFNDSGYDGDAKNEVITIIAGLGFQRE